MVQTRACLHNGFMSRTSSREYDIIPPEPAALIESLRSVGYTLPAAVADSCLTECAAWSLRRWSSAFNTSMAVRNSAVVGVIIIKVSCATIPPSVTETWTGSFSSPPVKQFMSVLLCSRLHNMKAGFWQASFRGYGQDPIQFEECKGIL
jgi:hypothetical protein